MKFAELLAACPFTVTMIGPEVAPPGTVTTILVEVPVDTIAGVPLNFTILLAGVVSKLVPLIVTDVPTNPLVGLKLVTVGTGTTVKISSAVCELFTCVTMHGEMVK